MLDVSIQNIIEKIRNHYENTEVSSFSEEQEGHLNNILSALRGPDGVSTPVSCCDPIRWPVVFNLPECYTHIGYILEELKRLTTCRIRSVVDYKFSGNIKNDHPLDRQEIRIRDTLLENFTYDHFRFHYNSAVRSIRMIYGYELSTEEYLKGGLR